MSPRQARALVESALAEAEWPWCRSLSLLLDELVAREEGE